MAEEEKKQSWITKKDPKWITKKDPKDTKWITKKDKKITNTLKKAAKELMETLYSIPSLANLPATLANTLRNITQKKAEDKGVEWITKVQKQLLAGEKSPEGVKTGKSPVEYRKKSEKAKGGIVQKFSKGGTVERPRGVGIAKRGYGKVMR